MASSDKLQKKVAAVKVLERQIWAESEEQCFVDLTLTWSHMLQEELKSTSVKPTVEFVFQLLLEDLSRDVYYPKGRIEACLDFLVDSYLQGKISRWKLESDIVAMKTGCKRELYIDMAAQFIRLLASKLPKIDDEKFSDVSNLVRALAAVDCQLLHHTVTCLIEVLQKDANVTQRALQILRLVVMDHKNNPDISDVFSLVIKFLSQHHPDEMTQYLNPTFLLTAKIKPMDLVALSAGQQIILCLVETANFNSPIHLSSYTAAVNVMCAKMASMGSRSAVWDFGLLCLALSIHGVVTLELIRCAENVCARISAGRPWIKQIAHGHLRSLILKWNAQGKSEETLDVPECDAGSDFSDFDLESLVDEVGAFPKCLSVLHLLDLLITKSERVDFDPRSLILHNALLTSALFATICSCRAWRQRRICSAMISACQVCASLIDPQKSPLPSSVRLALLPYAPVIGSLSIKEAAVLLSFLAYSKETATVLFHLCEQVAAAATCLMSDCNPDCEHGGTCLRPLTDSERKLLQASCIKRLVISDVMPIQALISRTKSDTSLLLRLLLDCVESDGQKIWSWLDSTLLNRPLESTHTLQPLMKLIAALVNFGCVSQEKCEWLLGAVFQTPLLLEPTSSKKLCVCTETCDCYFDCYMSLASIVREYVAEVVIKVEVEEEGLKSSAVAQQFCVCLVPYYLTCFNPEGPQSVRLKLCGLYGVSPLIAQSHAHALALMNMVEHEPFLAAYLSMWENPKSFGEWISTPEVQTQLSVHRAQFPRECDAVMLDLLHAHRNFVFRDSGSGGGSTATRHPMLSLCLQFFNPKGRFVPEDVKVLTEAFKWQPDPGAREHAKAADNTYARRNKLLTCLTGLMNNQLPQLIPMDADVQMGPPGTAPPKTWELCIINAIIFQINVLLPLMTRYLTSCTLSTVVSERQTILRYLENRTVWSEGPKKMDPSISLQSYCLLLQTICALGLAAPEIQPTVVRNLISHLSKARTHLPDHCQNWISVYVLVALALLEERSGIPDCWRRVNSEMGHEPTEPHVLVARDFLLTSLVSGNALVDPTMAKQYMQKLSNAASGVTTVLRDHCARLLDADAVIAVDEAEPYESWAWLRFCFGLRDEANRDPSPQNLTKVRDVIVAALREGDGMYATELGVAVLLGIPTWLNLREISLADTKNHVGWTTKALMDTVGLAVSSKDKTPLGKLFLSGICDGGSDVAMLRNPHSSLLVASLIEAFRSSASLSGSVTLSGLPAWNLVGSHLREIVRIATMRGSPTTLDMHVLFTSFSVLARISALPPVNLRSIIEQCIQKIFSSCPSGVSLQAASPNAAGTKGTAHYDAAWYNESGATKVGGLPPITQSIVLSSLFSFCASQCINDISLGNILMNIPKSSWWEKMDVLSKQEFIVRCVFACGVIFDSRAFQDLVVLLIRDCEKSDHEVESFVLLIRVLTTIALLARCTGKLTDPEYIVRAQDSTAIAVIPVGWRSRLGRTWVTINEAIICGVKEVNRLACLCYAQLRALAHYVPEVLSERYRPATVQRAFALFCTACLEVDGVQRQNEQVDDDSDDERRHSLLRILTRKMKPYNFLVRCVLEEYLRTGTDAEGRARLVGNGASLVSLDESLDEIMCQESLNDSQLMDMMDMALCTSQKTRQRMLSYVLHAQYPEAVAAKSVLVAGLSLAVNEPTLLWILLYKSRRRRLLRRCAVQIASSSLTRQLQRWHGGFASTALRCDVFRSLHESYADDLREPWPLGCTSELMRRVRLQPFVKLDPCERYITSLQGTDTLARATGYLRRAALLSRRDDLATTELGGLYADTEYTAGIVRAEMVPREMIQLYCERNANHAERAELVAHLRMLYRL